MDHRLSTSFDSNTFDTDNAITLINLIESLLNTLPLCAFHELMYCLFILVNIGK